MSKMFQGKIGAMIMETQMTSASKRDIQTLREEMRLIIRDLDDRLCNLVTSNEQKGRENDLLRNSLRMAHGEIAIMKKEMAAFRKIQLPVNKSQLVRRFLSEPDVSNCPPSPQFDLHLDSTRHSSPMDDKSLRLITYMTGHDPCMGFLLDTDKANDVDLINQDDSGSDAECPDLPQHNARERPIQAVLYAAEHGHERCLRLMIEKGVNLEVRDAWHRTALIVATRNGHCACVDLLLQNEADANASDQWRRTALITAADKGHCDIVESLLAKGARVDGKDHLKETALKKASENGHMKCARLLLANGASVNEINDCKRTVLMEASAKGHAEVAKTLLEKGATVNSADQFNKTALMEAASNGQSDCLRVLLSYGANVDDLDEFRRSSLMFASAKGQVECVKLLLGQGANVNIVDQRGRTALSVATENKHAECVAQLENVKKRKSDRQK